MPGVSAPAPGTHIVSLNQITWNWSAVAGATGYKWSTTNDFASATDLGAVTSKIESGMSPNVVYTLYVWAYHVCGNSTVSILSQATATLSCGCSMTINHLTAGGVAPVNKTTTYGIVNNIPVEPSKCWITSNLGSDHQASSFDDSTEASAGWYWQFNRKQGYKNDGTTLTPAWTITSINENSNWLIANDPCSLLLGSPWRIPTQTEWDNVDITGGWNDWTGPWNSGLKLHAAGYLYNSNGFLYFRGSDGYYWSSAQYNSSRGNILYFTSGDSYMNNLDKAYGRSVRCLRDY